MLKITVRDSLGNKNVLIAKDYSRNLDVIVAYLDTQTVIFRVPENGTVVIENLEEGSTT